MRKKTLLIAMLFVSSFCAYSQNLKDDFEGNGNIGTWKGDDCLINTGLANPVQSAANTSAKVLEYTDNGGLYANVRFDVSKNFDLSKGSVFSFKIYIPSGGLSGNQPKQVSVKLQDGKIAEPWSTQTEIIKPLLLDQWQTITFDFEKDKYVNLNGGSLPPVQRKDFNRVVIQINGENNIDSVLAYIDDFDYQKVVIPPSIYNTLVWADEFETNGPVNANNWFHQTQIPGGGSWYNGEIQHYTNRLDNSVVANGNLKVIAKKETFTDQSVTKDYTSARLNSKFAFKYGRVEFRAKLPSGAGTWPAVWMLGKNVDENGAYWDNLGYGSVSWPACGEIDIMEHWGTNQNFVQSALHTPSSFGNTVNLGGQTIPTASTDFHVYSFEWSPTKLEFSVDSNIHYTYNPSTKNADTWPFDAEQYFIINIAIQSSIIGTSFTQSALELDYIRVYQEKATTSISAAKTKNPVIYPNPVNNQLTITIENTSESSMPIQIHSVDGKLVMSNTYDVVNNAVYMGDLEVLDRGIYVLTYAVGGNSYRARFIKN
jgi:beta-glucanase (GH16 family)